MKNSKVLNRLVNIYNKKGLRGVLKTFASRIFKYSMFLQNPYDFVQSDTMGNLHLYLKKNKENIRNIVIVGAHKADELNGLKSNYRSCSFHLFEASPRYSASLLNKFESDSSVIVHPFAIGNCNGTMSFYETSLEGSGSLHELADLAIESYEVNSAEKYEVECKTLDSVFNNCTSDIDCLWIDVQGAEMRVLQGATECLARVKSVFIEVSVYEPLYKDGAVFDELYEILMKNCFVPCSLGTDNLNGTGNAFFVRKSK